MKIKEKKQKSSPGDQEEKKKMRMRNEFETWVLAMVMKHGFQLWPLVGLRLTVRIGDDVWQ